jgi:hypothetical protein
MAAEDIRDLQRRAQHARRALGGWLVLGLVFGLVLLERHRSEAIQGAHDLADRVGGDLEIERGGLELGMPKRSRVIMRSSYLIENRTSAAWDLVLPVLAVASGQQTSPRLLP